MFSDAYGVSLAFYQEIDGSDSAHHRAHLEDNLEQKMSKVQTLRVVVKQRLTAAAEEIFELFERTIAEYEEELCRHRKLLDAVCHTEDQLHRTGL